MAIALVMLGFTLFNPTYRLAENVGEASIPNVNWLNLLSLPISNKSAVRESQLSVTSGDKIWVETNCSSQINTLHRNLSYAPFKIGIPQIGTKNVTITQIGISQTSSFHIATLDNCLSHYESIQVRFSEVGVENSRVNQGSILKIGSSEVAVFDISPLKVSTTQISPAQIGIFEGGESQINSTEVSPAQNQVAQVSVSKIPFPSRISLQEFFSSYFSSHNLSPASTNTYNSNLLTFWQSLCDPTFNLTFQITDLPAGQLAEAQVTKFDSFGRPLGVTLLIDDDANGIGWFIDSIPKM